MNLKRAVHIGLALYVATIVVRLLITLLFIISGSTPPLIFQTSTYLIISFVSLVILISLASIWYFRKARRNTKEGFKLGITFMIINFLLDIIYIKLVFPSKPIIQILHALVSDPSFYIMIVLIVALVTFIGTYHKEPLKTVKRKHRR